MANRTRNSLLDHPNVRLPLTGYTPGHGETGMRLWIVQHGDALAKGVDPNRPLSEKGRSDVERLASHLAGCGVRVASFRVNAERDPRIA